MAKKQAIGIDVDGNFVKLVSASLNGSKLTVDNALVQKIESSSPEDASVQSNPVSGGATGLDPYWREVNEAISAMTRALPGKKKYAAASVSMMNSVHREVSFAGSMSEKEIINSLGTRLKSQLPSPLDEMFYDYDINKARDGTQVVSVFATSKRQVQPLLRCMEMSGLTPIVLEVEGQMTRQFFEESSQRLDPNTLFVDLKNNSVHMYIFSGDEMKFSKELPVALPASVRNKIHDAIFSDKLHKLSGEVSDDELVSDIEVFSDMELYRDSLSSALETELRLYGALHGESEPTQMVYYGTGSIVPDLHDSLVNSLSISDIVSEIPYKIGYGGRVKKATFKQIGGFYSQALQLARRGCEGVSYV